MPADTSFNTSPEVEHLGSTPFLAGHVVERYRFGNGLQLLFVSERSAPVFSYQTWFRVGARDDRDGITGIAHLFEHMMFKATTNHPEGEFMQLLEAAGAPDVNAWTWNDETVFLQSLPAGHLDLIAGLEADRMQHLDLTEETFETERQVVINERRLRVENDPYGLLNEKLWHAAFDHHPYGRPVIGWRPDLDAISLDDCREFYRSYYAPNNATLIVVGDLPVDEVVATVLRHYGGIESQPVNRPAVSTEPEQVEYRDRELELAAETEILMMGVKIPATAHPDHAALLVLDRVLFGGRSSRLYRKLVDAGLAARVSAFVPMFQDASLYDINAILRPGRTAREAEAVILDELDELAARPVTEEELRTARNKIKASFYGDLKETRGIAELLGIFEIAAGRFETALRVLDEVERLQPDQIQDAARRNLTRTRTTSAIGRPRSAAGAAAPDSADHAAGAAGADDAGSAPAAPAHGPCHLKDAPRPLPTDGGGQIFVVPEPRPPLLRASVVFHAGALLDPPGREGLAYLTARMLTRGTARRDKDRLEVEVDALGGSLETQAGLERIVVAGETLAETSESFFDLLVEVLGEPTFPEEELVKLKDETRARLVEMRNSDRALGTVFHESTLFGPHPYGRPILGTPETLDAIGRDDLVAFYRRYLGENGALAGAAGAGDEAALASQLRRALTAVGPRETVRFTYPDRPALQGHRLLLVDKPERTQTYVRIGQFGLTADHPDYPALDLANTVFGGGNFNAILFREIREKRGWSYGAGSAFKIAREPHSFSMAFSPAVKDTSAAINLSLQLFQRFVEQGVDSDALEFARQFTLGSSAFDENTPEKRLRLAMEQMILGYDRDAYLEAVRTVTREQVEAAMRRHFDPANLLITVVGTASDLEDGFRRSGAFQSVEVKPYDAL